MVMVVRYYQGSSYCSLQDSRFKIQDSRFKGAHIALFSGSDVVSDLDGELREEKSSTGILL